MQDLPLTIIPVEAETVIRAARLKMRNRFSYADAFAVVLAQDLHATLMTGDPELLHLRDIVLLEKLERR